MIHALKTSALFHHLLTGYFLYSIRIAGFAIFYKAEGIQIISNASPRMSVDCPVSIKLTAVIMQSMVFPPPAQQTIALSEPGPYTVESQYGLELGFKRG